MEKLFQPTHILNKGEWEDLQDERNWLKSEWNDIPKTVTALNEGIVAVCFLDGKNESDVIHTIYKGNFVL